MKENGQPFSQSTKRKNKYRLFWPLVKKSKRSNVSHLYVSHLKPTLLDRPKNHHLSMTGFKLLRKEPLNPRDAIFDNAKHSFNSFINNPSLTHTFKKNIPLSVYSHYETQPFFIFVLFSLFFHGSILLILFIGVLHSHSKNPKIYGNSNQGKPIDVVFLPRSAGQSGLKGEGYNGEPDNNKALPPPPPESLPSIASVKPPVPIPNESLTKNEDIITQSDTKIILSKKPKIQQKRNKINFNQIHHYSYRNVPSHVRSKPTRKTNPNSPFENLTNLDFSENPNSSHRRTAKIRPQGSRSSINMSTGPLVKNGQINTPYADKITIKGVSSDYSDLIASWIQQHMYYPLDAIRKGEDGSPSVHVVINRDGQVLSINLTNSSGSDALDAAILGMFRNAQLPKIPPDLPDHFNMDLKINYILLRQ